MMDDWEWVACYTGQRGRCQRIAQQTGASARQVWDVREARNLRDAAPDVAIPHGVIGQRVLEVLDRQEDAH